MGRGHGYHAAMTITTPKPLRSLSAWIAAFGATFALAAAPLSAQTISTGTLLVASPQLTDVNFARSVVLVLQNDENGAVGVVLNRPTNLVPATVFPELAEGIGTYDGRLFRGGPIAPTRVLYLVRGLAAATVTGPEVVDKVVTLVDRAEWKRRQYPPGPKVTALAFGRDRRLPITNRWREPID